MTRRHPFRHLLAGAALLPTVLAATTTAWEAPPVDAAIEEPIRLEPAGAGCRAYLVIGNERAEA
jgi:hypothetical protein